MRDADKSNQSPNIPPRKQVVTDFVRPQLSSQELPGFNLKKGATTKVSSTSPKAQLQKASKHKSSLNQKVALLKPKKIKNDKVQLAQSFI